MIFNEKMITALGANGSNVLLYFLESAFNFPSCGIKLNHLFGCERQVRSDERECGTFVVGNHDLDLASD